MISAKGTLHFLHRDIALSDKLINGQTDQLAVLLLDSWYSHAIQSIADLFSREGSLKSCKQYQPELLKLLQTATSQSMI